jgi:hypothetical protein
MVLPQTGSNRRQELSSSNLVVLAVIGGAVLKVEADGNLLAVGLLAKM